MALTGREDGPPLPAPDVVVRRLRRLGTDIAEVTDRLGRRVDLDPLAILVERAALAGHTRHGDLSCGGSTRLLRSRDDWMAVTLARPRDISSIPAWLDLDEAGEPPWQLVRRQVRGRIARDLLERAALLGIPVARFGEARTGGVASRSWAGPAPLQSLEGITVIDLSVLWAGPLCSQILQLAGARVIKVESVSRPDGTRRGDASFFDLLHAGKESVAVDFADPAQVEALGRLLMRADVVIEGSRPRALHQLGIFPERIIDSGGPRVWTSITGYGRSSDRVAFGDDAAVAGGLVVWDERGPVFCADAIADPATGLRAAVLTMRALADGGRHLLDVALAEVAAGLTPPDSPRAQPVGDRHVDVAAPQARRRSGRGPALGEHTALVLSELT